MGSKPQHPERDGYRLYWGDLHKHMTGPGSDLENLDEIISYARYHLDFLAVLCYPFKWYRKGLEGDIREETIGNDPEFDAWWERIQETSGNQLVPGEFVTYPAYEWNGNRLKWGDHNVIYHDEGNPLDDQWELPDLYANMANRNALVIPHHTGYDVGQRGGNWDVFDPSLSPVTELYSGHGSSEGVCTPIPMSDNHDMGPRTSGGTFRDALNRGLRVGAVASNDGPGLPGTWNKGIAGVWASELTRDGIWESIQQRRTYGVTGDRIELWWELGGEPMGSVLEGEADPTGSVSVDSPRPLDRIELVHNNRVVRTYAHSTRERTEDEGIYRMLVEFGWGPSAEYGDFESSECSWRGTLGVSNGNLERVWPRFIGFGQEYELRGGECRFDLVTSRGEDEGCILPESEPSSYRQGLVIEFASDDAADVVINLNDHDEITIPLPDVRERTHLFPFMEESRNRLDEEFDLDSDDIRNPDIVYHNARKVRVHPAFPRTACTTTVEFDDLPVDQGWNYYYVRASQTDGQYAWSSPVWIDR